VISALAAVATAYLAYLVPISRPCLLLRCDHERTDLTTRNGKSREALEAVIFSTEEQIQSIGEIPYPDFAEVKVKLHQVMKDAEALYDNVASLDQSMNVALDSWFRKENERTIGEIKAAELGYKRSFDAWHEGIRSGHFFDSEPPKPQSSGQQSQQSPIHPNPDYMPSSVKVNGPEMEPMQMDREPVYSGKQEEGPLSNSGLAKSNSKTKRSTLSKIESLFKPDAGKRRMSYSSS